MAENMTAIAMMKDQKRTALEAAMHHILHRMRRFMRAYPARQEDKMPEHDLVWVSEINGEGPALEILEANKCNPALWLDAIPAGVCIVPKSALKSAGLSDEMVEYFALMGSATVANHAAYRKQQQQQDRAEYEAKYQP
ncbi:hypothetical protein OEG84_11375 [Hoeflea sp. G2-23]|uniref:Uncharacterized protein n=1 Tax=Hoeflea algicola TaxID=2983763 RepID=A0ABT3Z9F5_9HYPH|nr:hypothetical protein [Hoeflea algicola]MCY0148293.1 hypothetical protein [Hoeflea algicola]